MYAISHSAWPFDSNNWSGKPFSGAWGSPCAFRRNQDGRPAASPRKNGYVTVHVTIDPAAVDGCSNFRKGVWLAALDDFRNYLITAA